MWDLLVINDGEREVEERFQNEWQAWEYLIREYRPCVKDWVDEDLFKIDVVLANIAETMHEDDMDTVREAMESAGYDVYLDGEDGGDRLYMADVNAPEYFWAPTLHRTFEGAKKRVAAKLAENDLLFGKGDASIDVGDVDAMVNNGWDVQSFVLDEGITGSVLCGDFEGGGHKASWGIHLMEVGE